MQIQQPSEEPVTEPRNPEPETEKYAYQGPLYEIVAVDGNVGVTRLNTCWVYTNRLDHSTDAFKDQVKMIITDIARNKSAAKLMMEIVTDKEIIETESAFTIAGFMEQYGGSISRMSLSRRNSRNGSRLTSTGLTSKPDNETNLLPLLRLFGSPIQKLKLRSGNLNLRFDGV